MIDVVWKNRTVAVSSQPTHRAPVTVSDIVQGASLLYSKLRVTHMMLLQRHTPSVIMWNGWCDHKSTLLTSIRLCGVRLCYLLRFVFQNSIELLRASLCNGRSFSIILIHVDYTRIWYIISNCCRWCHTGSMFTSTCTCTVSLLSIIVYLHQ